MRNLSAVQNRRVSSRSHSASTIVVLLSILASPPAHGDLFRIGPQSRANTYTTSDQFFPSVSSDSAGNFVVAWDSYFQDAYATGVFAQRFSSSAMPVGEEFQVNTSTTGYEGLNPRLYKFLTTTATGSNGDFLISWTAGPPYSSSVFARRFGSDGAALSGEFQVNIATIDRDGAEIIANRALPAGGFVVAWRDGEDYIYARRYDSAGNPAGAAFQIADDSDRYPDLAVNPANGELVAVWLGGSCGSYLCSRRFSSTGTPLGTEFGVTDVADQFIAIASSAAHFLIVWDDNEAIIGKRYASDGAAIGSEFQISTYTGHGFGHAQVAATASGGFVIVWESQLQSIHGQRYSSSGNRIGTEFQVSLPIGIDSYYPTVVGTPDDGFVVSWHDDAHISSYDVRVQRFSPVESVTTPGATATTDTENDGATSEDTVETAVTSPGGGPITITEGPITNTSPSGVVLFGEQVTISAPDAAANTPLILVFELDVSLIPPGTDISTIALLHGGALVPPCASLGIASPDPCVSDRTIQNDGDVQLTVLASSSAGDWNFGLLGCSGPVSGCRVAQKSLLLIKQATGDHSKDKLIWKWIKGESTDLNEFGDPINSTTYNLCVYAGTTAALFEADVPPNGSDWSSGGGGYKYKDSSGSADGVQKIILKESTDSNSKVLVKGKGVGLPDPALGSLQAPIKVQLVNSDTAVCFEATFDSAKIISNSSELFKAKTP